MNKQNKGLSSRGVKLWGFAFLALWVVSRALTRGFLGDYMGGSGEALMDALGSSDGMMHLATAVLICESLSVCAVPLFAALTVEAIEHTQNVGKYMIRLAILGLICEIPYDLLMFGKVMDFSQQNPVWSVLICAVALYFYQKFSGKDFKCILVWIAVTIAAVLWGSLCKVEYGLPMLLCALVLWSFRNSSTMKTFAGVLGASLCVLLSPFFMAAPMGALVLHYYNGEPGEGNQKIFYAVFPVMLLIGCGIVLLCK